MRALWPLLLLPPIAAAQFPPPRMTGIVLERDANVTAGQFSVRAPDFQVYRFQFDPGTAVERDGFEGNAARLNPGDKVEVESSPVPGSLLRYAVAVHVLAPIAPRLTVADNRLHVPVTPPAPSFLFQEGNLTFAGVVSRLNGQLLVLRTRVGEQTLLIRQDTRYIDNGDTVEAAELRPNMRVFVRAGKNLYEQLEVYQVIWGQILEPRR